jgi:hypothetical protein
VRATTCCLLRADTSPCVLCVCCATAANVIGTWTDAALAETLLRLSSFESSTRAPATTQPTSQYSAASASVACHASNARPGTKLGCAHTVHHAGGRTAAGAAATAITWTSGVGRAGCACVCADRRAGSCGMLHAHLPSCRHRRAARACQQPRCVCVFLPPPAASLSHTRAPPLTTTVQRDRCRALVRPSLSVWAFEKVCACIDHF